MMNVVQHQPGFWFLLEEGARLLLDVSCEQSAFSFDVLIELNENERVQYELRGKTYLNELAEAINYSAPAARGSNSIYRARNISKQYREEVMSAIKAWRAADPSRSA
jgi:hypothetical protein